MDYTISLIFTMPEIILTVSSLLLLLVAAYGGVKSANIVTLLSILALAGSSLMALVFLTNPSYEFGGDAFGGLYRMDAFGSFAKLLIYFAAIVSLMVAPRFFNAGGEYRPEYPVLIIFAAIGMGMMVSAADMLTLYVGLELNSLSAYVLASFIRNDERSAEAGLKYFVLGALASGMLLFGISLVYGFAGSTSFSVIGDTLTGDLSTGPLIGVVLVLAGLAFKISAVPFHMWTPDVYEGAPTPVTAFFASAPKVAAIALTVRVIIDAFGGQTSTWQQIIVFVALASIVLGAVAAIGQQNIKRLLAYSSINNVGFLLIGLAAGTAQGVSAMLFYLVIYVLMTLGSFICVMEMRDKDGKPLESLSSLAGLSQTRPGLAAAFAVFMFSLAGIPPLFGFWGKFLVFDAAVAAGMLPLAVIGIAASVIGAFYYIKVVKIIYFDEPANEIVATGNKTENGLIALMAVAVSPLGYLAIPALAPVTSAAARVLF
ncbi:NADH-quinone oxidoreductase subunit N [Parasphingorhabdus marina DSM 22363]|uniref:NADH-quinone oxidoreductase subunit N n=1 Tax=Parasphingorhabdus marina DSM 22363 TaxID=1123272 RepID=A0A1N6G0J9_9SPHN|nr:NADH-quinone oxidoreductase subunit NuoN [Parasphingorhabdus marina]SIO01048.1 NADH-quinone oxidoreductase subunit N [Parasphingorhabdus marina DSM 22363]